MNKIAMNEFQAVTEYIKKGIHIKKDKKALNKLQEEIPLLFDQFDLDDFENEREFYGFMQEYFHARFLLDFVSLTDLWKRIIFKENNMESEEIWKEIDELTIDKNDQYYLTPYFEYR